MSQDSYLEPPYEPEWPETECPNCNGEAIDEDGYTCVSCEGYGMVEVPPCDDCDCTPCACDNIYDRMSGN